MYNKEKFAKEIVEIACNSSEIAMDTTTMKLTTCFSIDCDNCYFSSYNYPHNQGGCAKNLAHWANAEYKEPKKQFTEREKEFIKLFPLIRYITKDKNGVVSAYVSKPEKGEKCWFSADLHRLSLPSYLQLDFLDISWKDEEPTSREEILGGKDD